MRVYVLVSFITLCLGVLISGARLVGEYPRTTEVTVGQDSAEMILRIACLAWAAFLLWGQ